jgi:hypothetical protein
VGDGSNSAPHEVRLLSEGRGGAAGIVMFLLNIACAAYIKFTAKSAAGTYLTVPLAAALLYFVCAHVRWIRHLSGSGGSACTIMVSCPPFHLFRFSPYPVPSTAVLLLRGSLRVLGLPTSCSLKNNKFGGVNLPTLLECHG